MYSWPSRVNLLLPILLALILYVLLKPAKRTQAPDDPFREEEGGQNE